MITIGITFCDKDYQYYDRLINQIKERVKLPYEIIIIDNTEGNKLGDKANFAFGYNALQFAARYKIIKMAKGDYIWFIDGDDEIVELDYISDADIIIFDYNSEILHNDKTQDAIYTDNFFNEDFIKNVSRTQLWNKLIKTDLYSNIDDYIKDPLMRVISLEDTYYFCLALKNAKIVETNHRVIYKHNPGLSTCKNITNEQFDFLITGYKEIMPMLKDLGVDLEDYQYDYLAGFTFDAEDSDYILKKLIGIKKDKDYWFDLYLSLYLKNQSIRQVYLDAFGEVPKNKYVVHYPDGREEVRYQEYQIVKIN